MHQTEQVGVASGSYAEPGCVELIRIQTNHDPNSRDPDSDNPTARLADIVAGQKCCCRTSVLVDTSCDMAHSGNRRADIQDRAVMKLPDIKKKQVGRLHDNKSP